MYTLISLIVRILLLVLLLKLDKGKNNKFYHESISEFYATLICRNKTKEFNLGRNNTNLYFLRDVIEKDI